MLNNLPHGVKISIARSIRIAFEQYMKTIKWSENKYNPETFMKEWKAYITEHSSWYGTIDEEVKSNPLFHEELAIKMNEVIAKTLTEEPTEEQITELDSLIKRLGIADIDYSCKSEAKFHIERLKSN